jgi:Tn3 transposase DDE domain
MRWARNGVSVRPSAVHSASSNASRTLVLYMPWVPASRPAWSVTHRAASTPAAAPVASPPSSHWAGSPKPSNLLSYLDSEDYRRAILVQLNRGEARHALARTVLHGHRGRVLERYREGQEDQLGALGLVTNAIILWNTVYVDRALTAAHAAGIETRDDDVARLGPLVHDHVNLAGRYTFGDTATQRRHAPPTRPRPARRARPLRGLSDFSFHCYSHPVT